jgi:hypothetical protein
MHMSVFLLSEFLIYKASGVKLIRDSTWLVRDPHMYCIFNFRRPRHELRDYIRCDNNHPTPFMNQLSE